MKGALRACPRVAAVLAVAGTMLVPFAEAAKPRPRPTASGSFTDHLTSYDTSRWIKADGWTNGSPFDNAWLASHAAHRDGLLELRLDDQAALGEPYSSGEVRTTGYYGYGCFEAKFRPVAQPGVVTSFFTFAGPYDNGGNGRHNEIDVEFLGYDTRRVQLNFWTNDDSYSLRNEVLLDLGFDAAQALHRYGFKWTSGGIAWYVDGNLVHEVFDSPLNPTPKAADSLQKIMVNLWPVDETAAAWAGTFAYPGQPLHAEYDWVRYVAGESCELGPEPAPPQQSGDPARMHVFAIGMALNARRTQAIASVSIVDGLGRAVPAAAVDGAWSGAITSGDTSRKTDANGVATFYSSQSRTGGTVTFCVTAVRKSGLVYDSTADEQTCGAIAK